MHNFHTIISRNCVWDTRIACKGFYFIGSAQIFVWDPHKHLVHGPKT